MPNGSEAVSAGWYELLEARKRPVVGTLLLLCVAVLIITALRDPVDYDGYWHLQMGKDWIENGLSPYKDHYSFTHQDETIKSPPVVFQAGLYVMVKLFGDVLGFIVVKLLAFSLVLACMVAWLRQIKAPTLVYCLVLPLLITLVQLRAQVRPELISWSLSIIALMLYHRARLRLTVTAIAPIVVLIIFWVNYHSSIFAYVIFFGLFVDIGVKLIKQKSGVRDWVVWSCWGLVLVGAGMINHNMAHPVYGAIMFPDVWKALIMEYYPPYALFKSFPPIHVLSLLTLASIAMAVWQRKFGYLVFIGVALYGGLSMIRLVTPMGIIFLGVFAHLLTDARIEDALRASSEWFSRVVAVLLIVIFLVPMAYAVLFARSAMYGNMHTRMLFPSSLVSYMRANNKTGRIFNEYHLGGYLIYKLSPESQVYIDGRTGILYSPEHFVRHNAARDNGKLLADEIEKYDIDFALLESSATNAWNVLQSGEFELDFVDAKFALYSRNAPALPATGRLWARPYCWIENDKQSLLEEWEMASSRLPWAAPVLPLMERVNEYVTSEDPLAWLASLSPDFTWNDDSKRFVGYRALEYGLGKMAIDLFDGVADKSLKDYLATALAYLRDGQVDEAEQTLDIVSRKEWPRRVFNDLLIMHDLLTEIQQQRPLRYMNKKFVDGIAGQVSSARASQANEPVSAKSFCVY
ncbi:MAG: hypothetical protein KUG71_07880 [Porticoccaceae bacterium]|nr:hypothetical protein [Porticoccaceae bacterium]